MTMLPGNSKPILGFGRTGWAASIVLASLACVVLLGYDLLDLYMRTVTDVFGGDITMWYVSKIHLWLALGIRTISFNLYSYVSAFVAMAIWPHTISRWRYAVLTACTLAYCTEFRFRYSWWAMDCVLAKGNPWQMTTPGAVTAPVVVAGTLIFAATASIRAAGCGILFAIACQYLAYSVVGAMNRTPLWLLVSWNLGVAAILLAWALRERVTAAAGGPVCAMCGYDLRGSIERCPECGHAAKTDIS